jgi:hypothetical protein
MTLDRFTIGIGAAVLAAAITFLLPVSPRRVNQTFVTVIIVALIVAASLSFLDTPLSLGVALVASLLAIIYRDILRFFKHVVYDVTKYRRRDYWYRRIGQSVLGSRPRRRR